MPYGISKGKRVYDEERGAARAWAKSQAERRYNSSTGNTTNTTTKTRVRDPEVAITVKTALDEGTGDHYFTLYHKSNHPNAPFLSEHASTFGELMELIQEVLEADLEEEL